MRSAMRFALAAAVAFFALFWALSHARANGCDAIAAAVAARIKGVTAVRPHNMFLGTRIDPPEVDLRAPGISDGAVLCAIAPGDRVKLDASFNGAYPPKSFFDFVAAAGAIVVVGATPAAIRHNAEACAQAALRKPAPRFGVVRYALVLSKAFDIDCAVAPSGAGVDPMTDIWVMYHSALDARP